MDNVATTDRLKDSKRMQSSRLKLAIAVGMYVVAVVLANIVTARFGLVDVGFGLMVTAGTYAAGFALLTRDFVHRYGNRWYALASIAVGGGLSWVMSTPALAIASTVAFVTAELVDLAVFEPIRNGRGFVPAALVSNVVSAPVDTFVFLGLAGFPITVVTVGGQFIGKVIWATMIPLAVYLVARRSLAAATERRNAANDIAPTAAVAGALPESR